MNEIIIAARDNWPFKNRVEVDWYARVVGKMEVRPRNLTYLPYVGRPAVSRGTHFFCV